MARKESPEKRNQADEGSDRASWVTYACPYCKRETKQLAGAVVDCYRMAKCGRMKEKKDA